MRQGNTAATVKSGVFDSRSRGLQVKLIIVEALVFVLPFLVFAYLFIKNQVVLDHVQMLIVALILMLILAGLIMLRQIFDRFFALASSLKKTLGQEPDGVPPEPNADELHEITAAFESLVHRFEATTTDLEKRVFELLVVKELIEAAATAKDIDALLDVLLQKVMAVTRSQTGSVFMVDSKSEVFRLIASRGLATEWQQNVCLDIKDSISRLVVEYRRPLLVENIETDIRIGRPGNPKYGSPSFLVMPVFAKENVIAVVNLSQKDKGEIFDADDQQMASLMIGEIAFALENITLHSEIGAYIDSLQKRTRELEAANHQLNQEIDQRKRTEAQLNQAYSDLKQTQAQLIQSGKLSSIGELAAGVAHELNQPLTVIRGHVQMLLKRAGRENQWYEELEMIERNTHRVMKIIDHLRTFSRQSKPDVVPLDVGQIIEDAFLLGAEQLRLNRIEVEKKFDPCLPRVWGDANQLEQVLLNLITNAKDAIEQHRRKSKQTGGGRADRITIEALCPEKDAGWVDIRVTDTGGGIPPGVIGKIFDPFFSTKEVGKGTGLGLSISYGIIKDHRGEIEVVDTGPKGTTFRVRLPAARE